MSQRKQNKTKDLEIKSAAIIEQEIEKLLVSGSGEDTKSKLDWLETASTLLSYRKNIISDRKYKQLNLAMILFTCCILFAGILWSVNKSQITVSMKTVSQNVGFTLSEKWSLPEPITTDCLRIEHFQTLHAPELGISYDEQSVGSRLEVKGENIKIETLQLGRGGIVDFDANSNLLTISVKQAAVNGSFSFRSISSLSATGEKNVEIKNKYMPFPETIHFDRLGEEKIPIVITFKIKEGDTKHLLKFEGMKIDQISFLKETPGGDHMFVSTIKQGTIKLYDIQGEEKIYNRDIVKMDHLEVRHLEISYKGDFHTLMEGKVKNLKIGPTDFERDLAPSYLEYIYSNQRLLFFLGTVISFFSFLWGIKETIFG